MTNVFYFSLFLIVNIVWGQSPSAIRHRGNTARNKMKINSGSRDVIANSYSEKTETGIISAFNNTAAPYWSMARSGSGFEFELTLLSIIEFEDSGHNGLDHQDNILNVFSFLNHVNWSNLTQTYSHQDDITFWEYQTSLQPSDSNSNLDVSLVATIGDLRGYVSPIGKFVAPDTWKLGIKMENYDYIGESSRLALKFRIKTIQSTRYPIPRDSLSPDQKDNPTVPMSDILISLVSSSNASTGYEQDKGFFSYETMGVSRGGVPEARSTLINPRTRDRTVRLIRSPIFKPEDDIAIEVNPTRASGKLTREYYVYFTFAVDMPEMLVWGPYVGIDSRDSAFVTSASITTTASICLMFLIGYALL